MDNTTELLANFTDQITLDMLSDDVLHETKRRLVDTFACAFGAVNSSPARIARSVAADVQSKSAASVIGLPVPTSMERAAFANTVMARYLDFNDMYFAPRGGGGHPSDTIPTSLAVGEALGARGKDVLLAIVLSYEVLGNLAGAVRLRERGWDQGLYTVVATALAAGKLLGLSATQLGHAVSLAITPHVPTRQTRVGELSMWKGCATAGAARNGVFAAVLAARGMTGPPEPFEGGDGIWAQVTGPFEFELPLPGQRPLVIQNVHTKYRPAEYNSQGALDLAVSLHSRFPVAAVERIDVATYWLSYSEIGSEPAKWDPQTRETADHSLPYLIAVALIDGEVGLESFTPERIRDPSLRPLMQKINVAEEPSFTERFPAELRFRITVTLQNGDVMTEEATHPRGHVRNPLSDDELDAKFDRLVAADKEHNISVYRKVRDALWHLDEVANVASATEQLRIVHAS